MSQYKFEDKELNEECPGKKKEVEDRLVQIDEMIEDLDKRLEKAR